MQKREISKQITMLLVFVAHFTEIFFQLIFQQKVKAFFSFFFNCIAIYLINTKRILNLVACCCAILMWYSALIQLIYFFRAPKVFRGFPCIILIYGYCTIWICIHSECFYNRNNKQKKNVSRKSIGILWENRGKTWIRLTENRIFVNIS